MTRFNSTTKNTEQNISPRNIGNETNNNIRFYFELLRTRFDIWFAEVQLQVKALFATMVATPANAYNQVKHKFTQLGGNQAEWSDRAMIETQKARAIVVVAGRDSLFTYVNGIGGSNLYFSLKRLLDIAVSLAVLILTLPMLLLIALLIKYDSPGPVIFKQDRITSRRVFKDGKYVWVVVPFTIYKFRTMKQNASTDLHKNYTKAFVKNDEDQMNALQNTEQRDAGTFKLCNDPRVTRLGNFLRRSSIDEIPQFFNVLLGDMSVVGPRPSLDYEVEEYQDWQMLRLACKQGITGFWQITGRSEAIFEDVIKQDIWYAKNQSLWLDIKIILKTPLAILKGKGAG